jgi:hypothetical protein
MATLSLRPARLSLKCRNFAHWLMAASNAGSKWGRKMIGNFELLSRLLIAALLGSVIGFERERLNWAAGLRTHMLVCVGAALTMLVSAFGFADVLGERTSCSVQPGSPLRWFPVLAFSARGRYCFVAKLCAG